MLKQISTDSDRSIVVDDAMSDSKAGHNPPPVFFYCSRNTAEFSRSDPNTILASIARQLSHPKLGGPLLQPTISIYTEKEEQGFASGRLRLEDSLNLILELAEFYPVITIVIDALDECNLEKRADLVDALERLLQDSSTLIKVFISSRDDQDIVFRLKEYPNLEISSNKNGDDLNNFIKYKTRELIRRRKLLKYSQSKEDMESFIVEHIAQEADG